MKKLFALLIVIAPVLALAGPPDTFIRREWRETQTAAARAAPTLSTEGAAVREGVSIMVELDAGSGKTLSGAGALDVYLYDKWDGTNFAWAKFPARQLLVPAGCASNRHCVIEALTLDGPRLGQRVLFAANGVTVSSGTTVVVTGLITVSGQSVSR